MHQRLWLLLLAVLLSVPACAADTDPSDGDDEDVGETVDPLTVGPTWRMATLIFTRLDTDYVVDGVTHHVKSTMSAAQIADIEATADDMKAKWSLWNGGRATMTMDKILVNDAVTRLSFADNNKKNYWVGANDIARQLDLYAPPGRYDSVFVIWNPQSAQPAVPNCCGYGLGPSADSNGATYANLPTAFHNGEAYVHEWLHGAGDFYRDQHGLAIPDPHDERIFGVTGPDSNGSWQGWYKALLRGRLLKAGNVVGYQSSVWRSGTPRHWVGGSFPTQAKPALAKPTLRRAVRTFDDALYLEWSPVTKTSHYTELVTIKKADGSNGKSIVDYQQPGIDRGAIDYQYFSKGAICAAARDSGVDLGAVHLWTQIWPDHQASAAASMDVPGTWNCL